MSDKVGEANPIKSRLSKGNQVKTLMEPQKLREAATGRNASRGILRPRNLFCFAWSCSTFRLAQKPRKLDAGLFPVP